MTPSPSRRGRLTLAATALVTAALVPPSPSLPRSAPPRCRNRFGTPSLTMRSFDVRDVRAAAVRLVALENQCTGTRAYAGDQDDDPTNNSDCKSGSDRGTIVHAAELQVFS